MDREEDVAIEFRHFRAEVTEELKAMRENMAKMTDALTQLIRIDSDIRQCKQMEQRLVDWVRELDGRVRTNELALAAVNTKLPMHWHVIWFIVVLLVGGAEWLVRH